MLFIQPSAIHKAK